MAQNFAEFWRQKFLELFSQKCFISKTIIVVSKFWNANCCQFLRLLLIFCGMDNWLWGSRVICTISKLLFSAPPSGPPSCSNSFDCSCEGRAFAWCTHLSCLLLKITSLTNIYLWLQLWRKSQLLRAATGLGNTISTIMMIMMMMKMTMMTMMAMMAMIAMMMMMMMMKIIKIQFSTNHANYFFNSNLRNS